MLVPITSSLFVPGETAPLDNVLVDVGTGYYIEKSIPQAGEFLERKLGLIENQAVNVQKAAHMKNQNLSQTIEVMNRKIMESRAGGGGGGGGGGSSEGGGTAI